MFVLKIPMAVWRMHARNHFLSGMMLAASLLMPAFSAWAEPTYDCPRLYQAQQRLSAPVTIGSEGWFFRANELKEHFELLPQTADYLKRLSQAFATQGSRLILMPVPLRTYGAANNLRKDQPYQRSFNLAQSRNSYAEYLKALNQTSIPTVNMLNAVAKTDAKTGLGFFLKRDIHWSPFGAELAAEAVATTLKTLPEYKEVTPVTFTTTITGKLAKKEIFASELQEYCDMELPAEEFPAYNTTRNEVDTEGEAALFGDDTADTTPQDLIVLLGSSFSAVQDFNFAGFLSEKTQMEVANFAISAGQLYNAIVSYASLPAAERLSPRFVIWENLAHYDLNEGTNLFRQIIPAIAGECSTEEAIASQKIKVTAGKTDQFLTVPETNKVMGTDYFLYLHADNLGLARFTLNLDYADGDGEWFTIDRSEHFNNTGRFFMELSKELESPLTRVTLEGMDDLNAEVEIRLCRRLHTELSSSTPAQKDLLLCVR